MKILLHFSYIRFKTIEFKNSTHSFIKKIKIKNSTQPIIILKVWLKNSTQPLYIYIYIHSCEY